MNWREEDPEDRFQETDIEILRPEQLILEAVQTLYSFLFYMIYNAQPNYLFTINNICEIIA